MTLHELAVAVAKKAETKRNKIGMDIAGPCCVAFFDVMAEMSPADAIQLFANGYASACARQQDAAVSD